MSEGGLWSVKYSAEDWKLPPKDTEERMHNYAIIGQFISEGSIVTAHPPASLFSGMHDIHFVWTVPKCNNKRCTQSDVSHGGAVRKKVPRSLKDQWTKRYFIHYEET